MPNAQCPMPNAQCPMPNAQCPLPIAQCPMPAGVVGYLDANGARAGEADTTGR
jgi:S-(hydroxymethyl)glutathione dehydrogenase / alcohol dehydrogenase